jgi:hypothetical protein
MIYPSKIIVLEPKEAQGMNELMTQIGSVLVVGVVGLVALNALRALAVVMWQVLRVLCTITLWIVMGLLVLFVISQLAIT